MKTKTAKCPNCCPDGGAILEAVGGFATQLREYPAEWECRCCGHRQPRRVASKRTAPSPSQKRIVDKFKQHGWTESTESVLIGNHLFVALKNECRKWWEGSRINGTIGQCGALKLSLCRSTEDVSITNDIALEVYVGIPRG